MTGAAPVESDYKASPSTQAITRKSQKLSLAFSFSDGPFFIRILASRRELAFAIVTHQLGEEDS